MTKRERLEAKKQKNFSKIEELKRQNIELTKESLLLSDEKQWFTEEEKTYGRGKKKRTVMEGRIHWNEFFKDGAYPDDESKGVWIKRSQVVMIDGEWL